MDQLARELKAGGYDSPEAELEDALATYCELGLMPEEDGRYLSLALPVNPNG